MTTLNIPSPQSYVPTRVEDWDIPDPAHQPLEVVREIRDQVEQRVTRLIHQGLDEIRSDRTAHQLRLARLLPDLVAEFDGLRTPDEIRACTRSILDDYDEANAKISLYCWDLGSDSGGGGFEPSGSLRPGGIQGE